MRGFLSGVGNGIGKRCSQQAKPQGGSQPCGVLAGLRPYKLAKAGDSASVLKDGGVQRLGVALDLQVVKRVNLTRCRADPAAALFLEEAATAWVIGRWIHEASPAGACTVGVSPAEGTSGFS
jgi:hypothetical protein